MLDAALDDAYGRSSTFHGLFFLKDDENQRKQPSKEWVIEVLHDLQRGHRKGSNSHGGKHLRPIGDNTLDETGDGILDTGTSGQLNFMLQCNFPGDRPHDDDRNGIVGDGKVHQTRQ
jgi:hypothetical protein